jgi:large subunit ribosomal protein L1
VKSGKIDFKVDKTGIIHAAIGRASFDAETNCYNAREPINTLVKLKPTAAKVYKNQEYFTFQAPGAQVS